MLSVKVIYVVICISYWRYQHEVPWISITLGSHLVSLVYPLTLPACAVLLFFQHTSCTWWSRLSPMNARATSSWPQKCHDVLSFTFIFCLSQSLVAACPSAETIGHFSCAWINSVTCLGIKNGHCEGYQGNETYLWHWQIWVKPYNGSKFCMYPTVTRGMLTFLCSDNDLPHLDKN